MAGSQHAARRIHWALTRLCLGTLLDPGFPGRLSVTPGSHIPQGLVGSY